MDVLQALGANMARNSQKAEASPMDGESWEVFVGENPSFLFGEDPVLIGKSGDTTEFSEHTFEIDSDEISELRDSPELADDPALAGENIAGSPSQRQVVDDIPVIETNLGQQMFPTVSGQPAQVVSRGMQHRDSVQSGQLDRPRNKGQNPDPLNGMRRPVATQSPSPVLPTEIPQDQAVRPTQAVRADISEASEQSRHLQTKPVIPADFANFPFQDQKAAVLFDATTGKNLRSAHGRWPVEAHVQGEPGPGSGRNLAKIDGVIVPQSQLDFGMPDQKIGLEKPVFLSTALVADTVDTKTDVDIRSSNIAPLVQTAQSNAQVHSSLSAINMSATQRDHAVLMQISQAVEAGEKGAIELRLDPAELGKVRIQMVLRDGIMMATIQAERPETLELLRRNSDSLDLTFAEQGYGGAELDFQEFDHDGNQENQLTDEMSWSGSDEDIKQSTSRAIAYQSSGLDIKL